jgi:hypothetical protein
VDDGQRAGLVERHDDEAENDAMEDGAEEGGVVQKQVVKEE